MLAFIVLSQTDLQKDKDRQYSIAYGDWIIQK